MPWVEWGDAHPLAFWLLFVVAVVGAMTLLAAVGEWRNR